MRVLLDEEIAAAGFRVVPLPKRVASLTHGEEKLARRLADRTTQDLQEPRVRHDVDCIAGVLILRQGHRSQRVETAKVLFVATSVLVIRNTRLWWEEDECETGVPPLIHIRALANLAWLKRPALRADLQLRELIALCAAAMRPSQKAWHRFLTHLEKLQQSQRLSSDQASAIIVSAMSDRLLREAELDADDAGDMDAGTLDEVVDRVISEYGAQADRRVGEAKAGFDSQVSQVRAEADERTSRAEEREAAVARRLRHQELVIDGRARGIARAVTVPVYWVAVALVLVGIATVAYQGMVAVGWAGFLFGSAILLLALLEVSGRLSHLHSLRHSLETRLHRRIRRWLGADIEDVRPT